MSKKSGRPRKPMALHILEGTFRSDRHGDDVVRASGEVEKPHFTNAHASDLWDRLVDKLFWVKSVDTAMLQTTCHFYGLYMAAYEVAENDPTDRDARTAVTSYWAKFEKGCSVLGLNPSDRGRLQVEKPQSSGVRRREA